MRFFYNEKGFSTVGTALALLLTLSMVFSMGRVYRVMSLSAEVQGVADAAALAAQNEVAEFMVVVRVCDAMVLSLSLTGFALYGASVAALCAPSGAAFASKLMNVAAEVLDARDEFSLQARTTLAKVADALPYLAAANAMSVTSANNELSNSDYAALALLVPFQTERVPSVQAEDQAKEDRESAEEALEGASAELQEKAQKAEEVAREAYEVKERAFARDCGDAPGYCMSERAEHLAGLQPDRNPSYSSVDAWSFAVPLERAKSYYSSRLANEKPLDSSVEEGARSALRRVFYEYALSELADAYVRETEGAFDAWLPLLPQNTDDMRATRLYVDPIYPVTSDGAGGFVTHAWEGCPLASSFQTRDSIAAMEQRGDAKCSACGFSAASLGKVSLASSSVETGFEHHYNEFVLAAREYEQVRDAADGAAGEVRDLAGSVFEMLVKAMKSAAACRIDIVPPGSLGVIALATSLSGAEASTGFETSFLGDTGSLGTRIAVAAATMVEDESDEGRTVVNSMLDGLASQSGAVTGAAEAALECWSLMLRAYSDGEDAAEDAFKTVVNAVPLADVTGLSSWAEGFFEKSLRSLGLQPARLEPLKPVLVNSSYVAAAGTDGFPARYMALKKQILQLSGPSANLFSSVVSAWEEHVVDEIEATGGKVELVLLEVPELGISIPVTISLPEGGTDRAIDFIHEAAEAVRGAYAQITEERVWE